MGSSRATAFKKEEKRKEGEKEERAVKGK